MQLDFISKVYFHNSETQRQWAFELLGKYPLKGNEKILDFGCGDGKISAEISRLAPLGHITGVEISKSSFKLAQMRFPSDIYSNLEFKLCETSNFTDYPGKKEYDRIYAFSVFHLLSNYLEILNNFKNHLKPHGVLSLTIPTGNNLLFYQAAHATCIQYNIVCPWKKIYSGQHFIRTAEDCRLALEAVGYKIQLLETVETDNPFSDFDEYVAWMIGSFTELWDIPPNTCQAFFTQVAQKMYQMNPEIVDQDGRIRHKMPRIHAIATL